jgi:hypothetical protein
MRMEVIENGKPVPKEMQSAVLLDMSDRFRARQLHREQVRHRPREVPDRRSVAVAMLAVEVRLVKAFWTIARQPLGAHSPIASSRCGIEYLHERSDIHSIYADAAGGKWEAIAPRPSLPSSKDIDAANEALDWLLFIDDELLRKVLVIGATAKRGDLKRRIGWERLRPKLREFNGITIRTIQRRYQEALRIIVSEMTIARMSNVSHNCC